MRPAVVCAGRLGTLDLPACVEALRQGHISGLAIDAVEAEDIAAVRAAVSMEPVNLLATPHVGAQQSEVRARLDDWVVHTLMTQLRGTDA